MSEVKRRSLAVLSAGIGQPSSTRLLADQLATATVAELRNLGCDVDLRVVEVREHARELGNAMVTGFPPTTLRAALEAVSGADGLIAVTPTFRASFSGLFKSFIDVLDDEALEGKPVALGATGGSARHSLVLEHAMRPIFTYMRAVVVPTAVFAATDDWAGTGEATPLRARITRAGRELAAEIARREPASPDDPFALPTSFEDLLSGD